MLKQNLKLVLHGINHLLWPVVCVNCEENITEAEGRLCRRCWEQLQASCGGDYCRRCGRDVSRYSIVQGACPGCQGKEIYFDGITRSGVYKEALRRMILSFKKGREELNTVLGFLAQSALQGGGFCGEIDLLVPVPLHFSRRLVRGYNQSLIIAKRLNKSRIPINTDLVRIRRTRPQPMAATLAARARNVKDAFAVRRGHEFADKNICLVDDIKTTGATLNECAKTLKEAGASKVYALVLAVAGQNVS